MTIGGERPSVGTKIAGALMTLLGLSVVFALLVISGTVLEFILTQGLLTPADRGALYNFFAKPERPIAKAAEYAELVTEAERARPRASAQDLAELYDSGPGVAHDPVLAAVFAWRAAHDSYFGLCTGQDDCGYAYRSDLSKRLGSKLSISEQEIVREVERYKYPELASNYILHDIIDTMIFIAVLFIFIIICMMFFSSTAM